MTTTTIERPAETTISVDLVTDPVRRALLDAADLIEQHGLAKGERRNSQGAYCVGGALMQAVGVDCQTTFGSGGGRFEEIGWFGLGDSFFAKAVRTIEHITGPFPIFDSNRRCIACWNNTPERTAAEVVSTLRQAALVDPGEVV